MSPGPELNKRIYSFIFTAAILDAILKYLTLLLVDSLKI